MTDLGNLKPNLVSEVGQDRAEDRPGPSEPLSTILVLFIVLFDLIFL